MALTKTGKYRIVGFSKQKKTINKALKKKIVDEGHVSIKTAVADADVVFICVPISAMRNTFINIAPHLKSGCIVTDVGSTKRQIMQWAGETLPQNITFIGGHPMAGSEKRGIDHIVPDLFARKPWCLIAGHCHSEPVRQAQGKLREESPTHVGSRIRERSLGRIRSLEMTPIMQLSKLIISIGAKPITMTAQDHDKCVALISHLPFIISRALLKTAISSKNWPQAQLLASTGFANMTRLAHGNTQMHKDICMTNKENISQAISLLEEVLKHIHRE